MHRGLRLTIVLSLTACYVVGRLALLALPGVSFSYLVLFLAGVAFGPRVGASVGILGRLASDLVVSGLNPVFLPMALVEGLLGLLAGLVGRVVNLGHQGPIWGVRAYAVLLNCGFWFTAAFSVLADSTTWLFYNFVLPQAPDAARSALWGTLVLSGLLFNIPSILFNAVLFPSVVPPILRNLDEAGLLPQRAPPRSEEARPSPAPPE